MKLFMGLVMGSIMITIIMVGVTVVMDKFYEHQKPEPVIAIPARTSPTAVPVPIEISGDAVGVKRITRLPSKLGNHVEIYELRFEDGARCILGDMRPRPALAISCNFPAGGLE